VGTPDESIFIGDPVYPATRREGPTSEGEDKITVIERLWAEIEKQIHCEPLAPFKIRSNREREEIRHFAVKTPE